MSPFLPPFPHLQTDHACRPCFRRCFLWGGGREGKQNKNKTKTKKIHFCLYVHFSFTASMIFYDISLLPFFLFCFSPKKNVNFSFSGVIPCMVFCLPPNDIPMGHLSLQEVLICSLAVLLGTPVI